MNEAAQPKQKPPARLRRRREFLRVAARGLARSSRAFKLQMAPREDAADEPARFGFTVTKRVAPAVERNRIRRRLKEALRLSGALAAAKGCDYVFVARREALAAPFADLEAQMAQAFRRLCRERTKTPKDQASKEP